MNELFLPIITKEEGMLPFILTSIGTRKNEQYICRPHGFPDYHWLHCVKGKGVLLVEERKYIIEEKTGFFFFPHVPHEYYNTNPSIPWETHFITFKGSAIPSLINLFEFGKFNIYTKLKTHYLEAILDEIYAKATSSNPFRGFECSYLLYKFIIELKNKVITTGVSKTRNTRYIRLQPVIDFIKNNYSKNPTLEDMASVINVTPRHMCRLFKQVLNISPFNYLTSYKMIKVREMLISSPNLPLKVISARAGFNSVSYFCTIFKEYEGITPLQFKKAHGLF